MVAGDSTALRRSRYRSTASATVTLLAGLLASFILVFIPAAQYCASSGVSKVSPTRLPFTCTCTRYLPDGSFSTFESKKLREAYNSYAKPAGISYDTLSTAMEYVATLESDKDAEGKTVSGSLKAKYVAYIQSMGLTPSQQKAMWLALKNSTWSDKGTPWE